MEKMDMMSMNRVQENIAKIRALFPECVKEVKRDGKVTLAVDFDELKQEMSGMLIDEREERYQMTWPDKRKAKLLANTSISATLRPCKEESVDFDNTQNLYIEGDNLDVLKLLQETYLGKVKMIYIDPPYNTGSDFVYEDDFAQSAEEYVANSGQYDDQGNRLVENKETNGRFHTDWLNMIYPRLMVARDLLSDDGAIFIHIDENEVYALSMICREILGEANELGTIIWDKRNPKGVVAGVAYQHESILVYCKNKIAFAKVPFLKEKEHAEEMLLKVQSLISKHKGINDDVKKEYKDWLKENKAVLTGGEIAYSLIDDDGKIYQQVSMAAPDKPETRSHRPLIHPITGKPCPVPQKGWRFTDQKMDELLKANKIEFGTDETTQPRQKYYLEENMQEAVSSLIYFGGSDDAMDLPFDNPKPVYIAKKLINSLCKQGDEIILDFFSGSATTAHAVMQLNAEDGGHRKFIMVQLPEKCDEKSEAYKEGYKNICEIGKERIRRAGKKIKENINALRPVMDEITDYEKETGQIRVARTWGNGITGRTNYAANATETFIDAKTGQRITHEYEETDPKDHYRFHPEDLDVGFRVLKLDSSNMKDVYYKAEDYAQTMIAGLEDNVKEDRTPLDLLFQVMLDLGQELSAKIEEKTIAGKTVWCVEGNNIIACFDSDINDQVVTEIAKLKPLYVVFRDSSFVSDAAAANCEQIFASISPATSRKVI